MEWWSVGGISESEGWPQRTQRAQRFGTLTDARKKNVMPQQLIDVNIARDGEERVR